MSSRFLTIQKINLKSSQFDWIFLLTKFLIYKHKLSKFMGKARKPGKPKGNRRNKVKTTKMIENNIRILKALAEAQKSKQ